MQLFYPAQDFAGLRQPRRFRLVDLQLGDLHHQLFALRQKLVQRGSSKRMVTGNPSIARNRPSKSERCMGSKLGQLRAAIVSVRAIIIARMCGMRSSAKNMCSGAAQADSFRAKRSRK